MLCYDKNISLKKYSTNFIRTWIRPLYFGQLISGYLTVFDSGIFPNFLKFPLDRPEAYPDFFQIFLWMRIRDVMWNSQVLADLVRLAVKSQGLDPIWQGPMMPAINMTRLEPYQVPGKFPTLALSHLGYYQWPGVWYASGGWNPRLPLLILTQVFWDFFLD